MFYKERERHKLSFSKPALLVIDVQNYFFDKNSPAYLQGSDRVLANIQELINKLRPKNIPIVATIHEGGNHQMYKWWGNVIESNWAKLMIEDSAFDYIIRKDTYDAFYNTILENVLNSLDIDQIIITGVMTHLCCETTARSAFVRGFDVIMVEDCLWDKDEWYHYASLKNLAHGFSIIASSDEIVECIFKY